MVPIYSVTSFISMVAPSVSIYFDLFRDCYEAYVLYQFFAMLIEFVNHHDYSRDDDMDPAILRVAQLAAQNRESGVQPIVAILDSKHEEHHPWPLARCLPSYKPNEAWLRHVKRMILQYVIVKPVVAILAAI